MDKIINLFIEKRKITFFIAIMLAFMGGYSYYVLPRQESPDISAPAAMVITPFPGASAIDVKDLVTKKVESALMEIEGYDEVIGKSKEGRSVVIVFFKGNTDINRAMQDVRNAVNDVQAELPSGSLPSRVRTDLGDDVGIIISLSGENYTYEQLASFGELFKDELSSTEGIAKFTIEGELKKEVKVEINTTKLDEFGLSIVDIQQILKSQNLQIPSGNMVFNDEKITVQTLGNFASLDDIRDTIISISPQNGIVVKLSDIANINMGLEEGVEKYKQNGENAVLLTGTFEKNKNIVLVGKDVRQTIDKVKTGLPEDLMVEEVIYQPDDVKASVNNFANSLLQGIILVIMVVFIGMGLRNALVVSTAIPLSMLFTFSIMYLLKIQIHQMSLTGLIIALGILVDNAIVVSDSVQVRIDNGETPMEAARKGTSESAVPIFTATLTTVVTFFPLLMLPYPAGKFLQAIPMVVIVSIIASYVVAILIIPSMTAVFFRKEKTKDNKTKKSKKIRAFFLNSLKWTLKRRGKSILFVVSVFVMVMTLVTPRLESEFFPFADKDMFYIEIRSEVPSNLELTEDLTDQVVELLAMEPEITSYTVGIGTGLPKFYITMIPAAPALDYGQMVCKFDLGDKKTRRFDNNVDFINYIQEKLDGNIAGGKYSVKLLATAAPKAAKVIVRVSGKDINRNKEVADLLKSRIQEIPGTINVSHDMKDETYEFKIFTNRGKASSYGINQYDIQSQINMALHGTSASVFKRDGKEYSIHLKGDIESLSELENFKIKSSLTNKKAVLKQFASINYGLKNDELNTYNGELAIEILANELPGYSPVEISNIIENEILPQVDTSGVKISFGGEREDINENFGVIIVLALFCIFLIYTILFIQFNSFMMALVILISIPLSFIGSIIGLYIFKQPLSLTAFLGIVALIGIVVNNGILLIEYIKEAKEAGYTTDEACIDAVNKRFNAITLSSITTVIGLVPLALSGSSLFGPMAISLMFGLMGSTFLTMVIIPTVYSAIDSFKIK